MSHSTSETSIFIDQINWKHGSFYIAATPTGLCYVGSPNESLEEVKSFLKKRFNHYSLRENKSLTEPYSLQFIEYFEKERTSFSFPLNVTGTPFEQLVWNQLLTVPYGEVTSYSDLGRKLKKPNAARAVGSAVGRNPLLIVLPCHRVVRKDGTHTGYRGGLAMKKNLLELENFPS